MQRATLIFTIAFALLVMAVAASSSFATPVIGKYQEDPRCDTIPNQNLGEELGDAAFFPINESIQYTTGAVTFTVCVPNDNLQNDWIVRMINTSGIAWKNLFFVVDSGGSFGNADGTIADTANAPN